MDREASRDLRLTVRIGADRDGTRLDALVATVPEVGSRAQAQRLIDGGNVTVNDVVVAKRHLVRTGDRIDVVVAPRPAPTLVPEAIAIDVIYEDASLLVVDKPAGLVTHPSRGHESGTLVHALLARGIAGGDEFRPGIVHRLDRDTSGLLVVAKSERVHRRLQAMLRDREVERRYHVLVHGAFPPALAVDQAIGRDRRNRLRMSAMTDTPREARTRFRTIERFDGLTLLEARLDTGRTHQIRVHLELAGFPVAGDPVYSRRGDTLSVGRQFLHAWRLALPHPETQEPLDFTAALPADLQRVLDGLRPPSDGTR